MERKMRRRQPSAVLFDGSLGSNAMAVNIKDLYGNSGKRFKNINTRWNFQ